MTESGSGTGIKQEMKQVCVNKRDSHEPATNPVAKTKCHTKRGLARQDVALNAEDIAVSPEISIYCSKNSQQWNHFIGDAATQPVLMGNLKGFEGIGTESAKREKNENQSSLLSLDGTLQNAEVDLEIKDPTPPSSPKCKVKQKKSRRLSKGVVSAMNALQKIRRTTVDDEIEDDVCIVGDDSLQSIQSHSFAIKIRLPSGVKKFKIKQTESFAQVFGSIAAMENANENDIFMFYGDKTVHIYDSPDALGLTVADILDCHIGSQCSMSSVSVNSAVCAFEDRMLLQIHLQMKDSRNKITLSIRKDEPMEKLMRDFCRVTGKKFGSLKFNFDGETLDLSATPESLDLETDYCIDVL